MMESTTRPATRGSGSFTRWRLLAIVALMVCGTIFGPSAHAQDATEEPETPDVMAPGTGDDQPGASTPVAEATSENAQESEQTPDDVPQPAVSDDASAPFVATDPGNPAVIAHGLAYLTGAQSVWQVRQYEPASASAASSEVTNASMVYQVTGSSVIRNDVTGKRALLNPGESYFKSAGDPYTTVANSGNSTVWEFELVGPTEVATDAFYESPLIDNYDEGVFDLVMVRYVLEPGESNEVPAHTGPALAISASGDIDIESSDGIGLLATADGQLISADDSRVVNNSQEPILYLMVSYGESVSDSTSAPGTGPTTDPTAESDASSTGESVISDQEDIPVEAPEDPADVETDAPPTGGNQESINITAAEELYVVVVADGITVFDGPIPAGGQSGTIVGSVFEVYTSFGDATVFTNSCGDEFKMGFESGEARYTLEADGVSCLG